MNDNWKQVKLCEISKIIMGQSPPSKYYNERREGIPFFQGVTEFQEIFPKVKKFTTKITKLAKSEDILMSVRAPVGELNVLNIDCCIGRGLCAIRSEKNARFIYYLLKNYKKYIRKYSGGITYESINKEQINNLEFFIPENIAKRNKITSILSAYDDLIENNNRRIEILEEMAQTIYKEWFVHFRFLGYEKVKMIDSELGNIPERWSVERVANIVNRISSGKKYNSKTVKSKGNIPVLDQGRSGIIGYHNDKPGIISDEENPVIVFANHTCYQRIILYPFSAIQNVIPFYPSKTYNRNIYWLHWATKDLIEFNDYKGHWPEFISRKLLLPDLEICNFFGKHVKKYVLLQYNIEQKNKILAQTRDLLLSKLISGEIDVSDLDINIEEIK